MTEPTEAAPFNADDEEAIRAMYPHIRDIMKEDWEDPAMEVYDCEPHDQT